MKKILAYISSAVAVLLSASCTERADLFDAGGALSFEAQITDLETRADYVAGEDKYHENEINTMDWFFFSDEEGTELLYHKTTTGENAKKLTVPEADVEANGLRGKSYLYAVANGPEGVASKMKLADILAMPVSTEFTKTEVDDEGSEALKLDVDNLKFIMDTYDNETKKYLKEITPKAVGDTRTITVQLSRLAVKFSTVVKIKKSVTTTDTFGNTETWTPILTQTDFDAYMMNALKAGTMSGDPVRRADEGVDQNNYFDYGRNLATVEDISPTSGDYFIWQTVDPFYTYPQKWNDTDNNEPYIKIIFPWMSDVKGSAEFHYKVVLPAPEDHVFTLERNCWYRLTATIAVLGGTENDYVLIDDVEVSVSDWAEPSWLSGSGLNSAKFFYVPTKEFDVYSVDSFDIPINTNSSAKAYITKIEFSDYSKTPTNDLVYSKGGRLGNNYVSTVNASTITGNSGDDNQVRFSGTEHNYSVSVHSEDRYNKYVTFNHELTNIYVKRDITIYIEHSERSDWNETVIIHQHPAIELMKQGAGDVFVNGYFGRVENATFGSSDLTATYYYRYNNNYRPLEYSASNAPYYHCFSYFTTGLAGNDTYRPAETYYYNYQNRNTYFLYNGDYYRWSDYPGYGYTFDISTAYGTIMVTTNTLDSSISTDFYTTDITVTAFSENNNYYSSNEASKVYYKIGDPRAKASTITGWDVDPYLSNETGSSSSNPGATTTEWTDADDILICSQDVNDRTTIAPHFLISSALNANRGLTWDQAVRRAATYQEAGYPAGRWRLPTEAEIAFIIARQNDGTLPTLYATNSDYWAGSGRLVETGSTGTSTLTFKSPDTDTHSCRFVYDLWYWGNETEESNVYHANGHIE